MKQRSIWAIILLMSLACVGIIFIQLFWINWFVKLNESNFDDKVYIAINEVKNKISENADSQTDALPRLSDKLKLKDNNSILSKKYDPILKKNKDSWNKNRILFEINSISKMLNTQELLLDLKPKEISDMIHSALKDQGIELEFEFGVFNNESKDYFIINDNYVVDFGDNEEASDLGMQQNLDKSKYRTQLFSSEYESPGFLSLYFINRRGFVWSSVTPWLIGSILFTSLILFSFSYTIFIIFRQKKIGEMKTDFINNMTHEFKTPIATISLASDSINNPRIIENPEKIKRFTNIIKQENQRMLAQVEKVLQMATIEKRDFELKISEVNLEQIINQVVDHANLRVEEKKGSISTNLELNNPIIQVDQTHITSIIHNLFDNAIKYSEKPPEIVVSAKDTKNGVKISVKDNGIGMDKESQKYIFDKFYRVHTGNRHDVKGFGLGLSYVKVMVDAHHGKIKVDSELGAGSNFTVLLPRIHKPQ